jgi:hypothetical protein
MVCVVFIVDVGIDDYGEIGSVGGIQPECGDRYVELGEARSRPSFTKINDEMRWGRQMAIRDISVT